MLVETTRFGQVETDESLVFEFISPVLGYDNLVKYIIVDHSPDSPFKWLQSMEDPDTAFPVTVPGFFDIDYQYTISEEDAQKLEIKSAENVLSLNIVRIPAGNPQMATVNLLGPIIINLENQKGMQLVLTSTNYSVNHKLFPENQVPQKEEAKEKKE